VATSRDLIIVAVQRLQGQVPALAKLRLVFGLELTGGGLTGPAKSDRYRVEVPGPQVSEGPADDARIEVSLPQTMFNLLAEEGQLDDWKDAFYYGHLKVEGDPRVRRLLGRAIERG
jgi:hypothetical protein